MHGIIYQTCGALPFHDVFSFAAMQDNILTVSKRLGQRKTLLSGRWNVCVQVSNGFGGSSVDQPQADRQTRAGTDPQTPHPIKWTYLTQSGQEELLHHQVAQSLRLSALISDQFDLNGLFGKVGNYTSAVTEETWMDWHCIACGHHINMYMYRCDVYLKLWY